MGMGEIFPEEVRAFIIENYTAPDASMSRMAHELIEKFPVYADLVTPKEQVMDAAEQTYWFVIFAIEDFLVNTKKSIHEQISLDDHMGLFQYAPVIGGFKIDLDFPSKMTEAQDKEPDSGPLQTLEEELLLTDEDALSDHDIELEAMSAESAEDDTFESLEPFESFSRVDESSETTSDSDSDTGFIVVGGCPEKKFRPISPESWLISGESLYEDAQSNSETSRTPVDDASGLSGLSEHSEHSETS